LITPSLKHLSRSTLSEVIFYDADLHIPAGFTSSIAYTC